MGLTSAGSWFQYLIATKVLAGLMYIFCENLLDDVLIHAESEADLLRKVRQVFDSFRKHKVTMNPDKCDFGMQQIEFVGHLIDSEGMRFSNKKLIGIREFKLPRSKKELKSFLGLANFFRDHV